LPNRFAKGKVSVSIYPVFLPPRFEAPPGEPDEPVVTHENPEDFIPSGLHYTPGAAALQTPIAPGPILPEGFPFCLPVIIFIHNKL
jgi:hypothetical protein